MVSDLEAQQLLCTEDGTQTNAECDLDIKAERDHLMETLVTRMTDATSSLKNGIRKAVGTEHVMEEVMATVIPTRPNLTPLTNVTTTQTSTRSKTTTTSVAAIRNIHHSNDDSLVQI